MAEEFLSDSTGSGCPKNESSEPEPEPVLVLIISSLDILTALEVR